MARERSVTPGHTVVYPNREKAAAKTTKLLVTVVMVVSAGLLIALTAGGWSKFQGMKGVNIIWALVYLLMGFYILKSWARGLLPMAAGFAILLLILAVVSGTGVTGASWFDRNRSAFAEAALPASLLGLLTVLLIPMQTLQIFFTMLGFAQGWNVETEMPIEEADKRGFTVDESDRELAERHDNSNGGNSDESDGDHQHESDGDDSHGSNEDDAEE